MTAGRVLIVCTANQCRSPMAELLFRQVLARSEHGLGWVVSSAGTHAVDGQPIYPVARELMTERGVDVDGFRSRRLTSAIVDDADLVLTAERSHRAEVVALVPDALHRAFTLTQFARLVTAGAARAGFEPNGGGVDTLIELARLGRSYSEPGDDDLPDPVGRPRRQIAAVAARIEAAILAIINALPVRSTAVGRTLPSPARTRTT